RVPRIRWTAERRTFPRLFFFRPPDNAPPYIALRRKTATRPCGAGGLQSLQSLRPAGCAEQPCECQVRAVLQHDLARIPWQICHGVLAMKTYLLISAFLLIKALPVAAQD